MNDFITLISQSLAYRIDDLTRAFFQLTVLCYAYYWINKNLSKKINSDFLRRVIIAILALTVYTIYYVFYLSVRSVKVRDFDLQNYFINTIVTLIFFLLYYLIINGHKKGKRPWNPAFKFFICFISFFLFFVGINFVINYVHENNPTFSEIILGKFQTVDGKSLSQENILFFFKQGIILNAVVALLAASIDAGCRYIFNLQHLQIKVKELETLQLKEQLSKAQLDALHAKVNPHFLYNSLNSIAGLAKTDGDKTQQMAVSLSKFFRYSINHNEDNLVTVDEEMEMVETYLKIEQIRFEERLSYEIIKAPATVKQMIPRFILQPLVENSVKHGMMGNENKLFIRVRAQMEGKKISLSVEDTGKLFGSDFKPGYGLKSIYDKLDILFPGKYEVALYNEPVKQVKILIKL